MCSRAHLDLCEQIMSYVCKNKAIRFSKEKRKRKRTDCLHHIQASEHITFIVCKDKMLFLHEFLQWTYIDAIYAEFMSNFYLKVLHFRKPARREIHCKNPILNKNVMITSKTMNVRNPRTWFLMKNLLQCKNLCKSLKLLNLSPNR